MEPQNKCKMQDPGYLMMMPPKVLRQQPNAKKILQLTLSKTNK